MSGDMNARDFLAQLRATEHHYLQAELRRELWVERALARARMKILELLSRKCDANFKFPDDEFLEREFLDQLDRIAWRTDKPSEYDLEFLCLFFYTPHELISTKAAE